MPVDPIILYGPSITHHEIEHVISAGATGWNARGYGYINAFRKVMQEYTEKDHSHAVSSCTGAMHLAMLAAGIGPGDEVLVPEIADISAALCVLYVGASPVFCDVDPLTLCLTPQTAARRLTPRSKAVIATHYYGCPCDTAALRDFADANKLLLLEDATHGLGGSCRGKAAGYYGHCSVFSFNSEEAAVAGKAGVLLTSDLHFINRAIKIGTRGRIPENPFQYDSVGYNYAISNMQAALGFAQMTRLTDLMEQKRRIAAWYTEGLRDVPGISLNPVPEYGDNSFLMTTLFLDDPALSRNNFMARLDLSRVKCRPTFFPLSGMPLFTRADNPVAHSRGLRGVVLPSGHNRTEEEIAYITGVIKELLAKPALRAASPAPTGWLRQKEDILRVFAEAKKNGLVIPFSHEGAACRLQALTIADIADPAVISLMARWRQDSMHALLTRFTVTDAYIKNTLAHYKERVRDYILFFIVKDGERYGHIGLDDFNFQKRTCVVDALYLSPDAPKGLGAAGSEAMYAWAGSRLGIKTLFNHIVASNTKARMLTRVQGFTEVNRTALYREEVPGGEVFRPMYIPGHDTPDEYLLIFAKSLEKTNASGGQGSALDPAGE